MAPLADDGSASGCWRWRAAPASPRSASSSPTSRGRAAPPTPRSWARRTRRIILFDTLLAEFPPEEIESVLAHELGHHVHGDVRRGLLVQGALMLVTFGLAALVSTPAWPSSGSPDRRSRRAPVAGARGAGARSGPASARNGFSRWIERQADDFALATTGNSPAVVGAMERLARLNLAERRPNRLKEIVL